MLHKGKQQFSAKTWGDDTFLGINIGSIGQWNYAFEMKKKLILNLKFHARQILKVWAK